MKDDQDFNIWFVKEIEKYGCLFNHADPHYTSRQKQEEAWQNIAVSSEATVAECKERWKNLRACFTRHLKHRVMEMRSGVKCKKGYYLAEHMNYILPFTRVRNHPADKMKYFSEVVKDLEVCDNVIYVDTDEDTLNNESSRHDLEEATYYGNNAYVTNDEPGIQNEDETDGKGDYFEEKYDPKSGTKRKRSSSEGDPDLDFFKSLLPDVRSMGDSQRRKFKIKVLTLIDEILETPGPSRFN